MEKSWILVFDSGSGGKHTMEQIRSYLPQENYLLFMDKINCPYGNKSKNKVKKIVTNTIIKIRQKFNIKLIIIACNTISSMLKNFLQKIFADVPFVFVLPQIDSTMLNKPTLVLCTKNTAKHNKQLKAYKKHKNFYVVGFGKLAKMIDCSNNNFENLQSFLNKKLKKYINKNIQNVVIGCTHFNYIKTQISTGLNTQVCFYDNSKNIVLQTKNKLIASAKLSRKKTTGKTLTLCKI